MKAGGREFKRCCLDMISRAIDAGMPVDEAWVQKKFGVSYVTASRYLLQVGKPLKINRGSDARLIQSHIPPKKAPAGGLATITGLELSGGFALLEITLSDGETTHTVSSKVKGEWVDGRLKSETARAIVDRCVKEAAEVFAPLPVSPGLARKIYRTLFNEGLVFAEVLKRFNEYKENKK